MLVSAIWLWPAIFGVVNRVAQGRLQGWGPASLSELLFQFWDWVAYAIVTPAIFWASARWPIIRSQLRRPFLIHLGLALLFCVVWAVVGKVLQFSFVSVLEPENLRRAIEAAGPNLGLAVARNVASWILTTIPFGVVVYTTVAALAHAITYFSEARDREVQMARLAEQLSAARFSALQSQVNPHFLFNTLNTVAVLVRDNDRSGAVRIIEQLSDVLRRTLSRHRADEVALEDELDLVRQYVAIEQTRFSDRLRPAYDIAPTIARAAVPSFSIQHLVENAIRHGIAQREEAGALTIAARREGDTLVVTVTDDGPGITIEDVPPGHGLASTRERLRLLHGDRGTLAIAVAPAGGTVATLRVPYRDLHAEATHAGR